MVNNQGVSAGMPPVQRTIPTSVQNPEPQDEQMLDNEALKLNPDDSAISGRNIPTSADSDHMINQPNQAHEAAPPNNVDEELLVRSLNTLRMEASAPISLITSNSSNDAGQSSLDRNTNDRLIAIEERLSPVVSDEDDDILLMSEEELQAESLRLMFMAQGGDDGKTLSEKKADAIHRRSNAVNERLSKVCPSPFQSDHESSSDIQQMSLYDLDEEYDRLVEEFKCKARQDPSHKDLPGIQRRHGEVMIRQRRLTCFPSDNKKELFEEKHIQGIMLSGSNLPRFLFRGSNSKSGGNDSESEPSSDDDSSSVKSQTVRMINEVDRIVPHAHFADPTMFDHPRHQNFNILRAAADWHTSARRFNTPFTSWSCDFETALYFAIGHFPYENEPEALEEAGLRNDWVFHDADVAAVITVIDTWTIPDRHLRVFHQPALLLDPAAFAIPSEFLIYGALDRADGIDLHGVSVQELRARLRCPTWPHCLSRIQLPHRPTFQDISEAWKIARAFMQDYWGGEEEFIDLGLAVLAGELARQQWAGFPPRPDAHVVEAQVQIQWPEAWMRRIRRYLERIALGPLGVRMSGMPLANVGTPYVGFPQFRLMQQLLLSWVMDYPSDMMNEVDGSDDEEVHDVFPLRHSCDNSTLLDTLTELQLMIFQSQMVKRDRDGNAPIPPPREYYSSRSIPPPSTKSRPAGDGPADEGPTEVVEANTEAAVQMQREFGQQHVEAGAGGGLPSVSGNPRESWPQDHRNRLDLREDSYQECDKEVPFTFCRVLLFIMFFIAAAVYFVLALAVY
ncbi:hypothetical protein N0V93_004651 [Gnomoniopsis smithogilvyi]|uniref:Uncharacterized protein n=1 Tax=Gnomoniopsis smithogilvyi TaxID=1191159 RepID=A0A9W9CWD3_9PEZI|nr:hypothetical protein N0V93_004651 [Gnomoniopsis smithogilvyi]